MAVWDSFTNQKQWESYLKFLLRTNEKALLKSIVTIYDNQTIEEKLIGASAGENKIGFNRWDAEEMMGLAKKIKRGILLEPNEITHAKIIMPKYWKQLMVISKQKQKERQEYKKIMLEVQEEMENDKIEDSIEEERLNACLNGRPCSYGICDECPVTHGYCLDNIEENEPEDEEDET